MVTRANLAVACRLARKYDRAQALWVGLAETYNARLQASRAANEAVHNKFFNSAAWREPPC